MTTPSSAIVRGTQIFSFALICGTVTFAVIAVMITAGHNRAANEEFEIFSLLLAGMSLLTYPLLSTVSRFIKIIHFPELAGVDPLDSIWRNRLMQRMAICEGCAFMNLLGYMISGAWWSLALAGGFILILLYMFPTETKLQHFKETQRLAEGGNL